MNKSKIFIIAILLSFSCNLSALAKNYDLSAQVLFNMGETLFKQKRYSEAREEFQKCLMLNPRYPEAKRHLELCEQQIIARTVVSEKNNAVLLALEEAEKKITYRKPASPPSKKESPGPQNLEAKPVTLSTGEESLIPSISKGAWTLRKGQTYAELYTKYYWHNHQFDSKGEKKRWDYDGKGNEIRTELKLEYGFNDKITLMLSTIAKEAHWKDSFKSCTNRGFVEMWPGVKYNLFTEPFICTLQGRVKFPFDYSEEAVPALGTHQIDGELKILTAQPWPKLPGYTKFEFGFRGRNEEPANEIPYFFEFGYNPRRWLVLKTTLDCSEGLAEAGGTDEDWMKYTVGPIFKIKDLFNIEFAFGQTFEGKNTSAAKEVICSLSSQW